jgi:hypothetical protein
VLLCLTGDVHLSRAQLRRRFGLVWPAVTAPGADPVHDDEFATDFAVSVTDINEINGPTQSTNLRSGVRFSSGAPTISNNLARNRGNREKPLPRRYPRRRAKFSSALGRSRELAPGLAKGRRTELRFGLPIEGCLCLVRRAPAPSPAEISRRDLATGASFEAAGSQLPCLGNNIECIGNHRLQPAHIATTFCEVLDHRFEIFDQIFRIRITLQLLKD